MLTSQIFMTDHVESTHLGLIFATVTVSCAAPAEASRALPSERGGLKMEKHCAPIQNSFLAPLHMRFKHLSWIFVNLW